MSLTQITAPAAEPVDIELAKLYARIDSALENSIVDGQIASARERVQAITRRQLITATWELWLDSFPRERWLEVPLPPLNSVTSVKYYDLGGVLQTLAASEYIVTAPAGPDADPGIICLKWASLWPLTYARPDAVQIRFICGYGAGTSSVPAGIREAMLVYIAEQFDGRGDPKAEEGLKMRLSPFIV